MTSFFKRSIIFSTLALLGLGPILFVRGKRERLRSKAL